MNSSPHETSEAPRKGEKIAGDGEGTTAKELEVEQDLDAVGERQALVCCGASCSR